MGGRRRPRSPDIDPEDFGYVKANRDDDAYNDSYECGWHPHQTDNPRIIADNLRNRGIERFLFRIDGVGQFDVAFSVYVHESEADKLDGTPNGKHTEAA